MPIDQTDDAPAFAALPEFEAAVDATIARWRMTDDQQYGQLHKTLTDSLHALRAAAGDNADEACSAVIEMAGMMLGQNTVDGKLAPADFFQPGHTYIEAKPFTAPEGLTVFRCIAVDEYPGRPGEILALGFATPAYPGDNWNVFLCRRGAWAEGWTEYDEGEAGQ